MAPWTAAHQASLSITNSQSLLKLMSIELVMPSNHLILCRPLLPPSTFPSIRVFSSESVLRIRWPKYWSFSFGISPSNEYSGLISFRMDLLDLLAVQGTLKSLLQHHSSIKIKWVNIFTLCLLISFFSKEDKCFFLPDKWKSFLLPILTLYMLPLLYSCDLSHLTSKTIWFIFCKKKVYIGLPWQSSG